MQLLLIGYLQLAVRDARVWRATSLVERHVIIPRNSRVSAHFLGMQLIRSMVVGAYMANNNDRARNSVEVDNDTRLARYFRSKYQDLL